MQFIPKYILSISVAILFTITAYFTIQDTSPSQSDGLSTNTGIVHKTLLQIDKETSTGKSFETVSQSGTAWQMSPFGTGKPLPEAVKKSVFQKPNIDWKPRTINGITYRLGEGNPTDVALITPQL